MKIYIDKFGNITKAEEVGLISGSWGENFIDFYYQENATYASLSAIRNDSFSVRNIIIPKTQRMYDTEQDLYFWRYEVEENDPIVSVAGQLELSVNFVTLVNIDGIAEKEKVLASAIYTTRVRKAVGSTSEEEYNDFLETLNQYIDQILATEGGLADNNEAIKLINEKLDVINVENIKMFLISGNEISIELYNKLINYNENAVLYYRNPPLSAICYLVANEEKELIYRGNLISNDTTIKTLTISINKGNRAITYFDYDKIESINTDITMLKKNVNDLINGGALEAGGWVKIDGILKPEEVSALYQTKGTGFYTITSEEYGKEAVIIDTSKTMFKRQTGKYDYTYNFDTAQWEILASGTGGGSGSSGAVVLTNKTPLEAVAAVGGEYKIEYEYTSTQDTKGTAQYFVDGTLRRTIAITTGTNEFDISQYVIAGERVITIQVADRFGNSNSLTFIITGIELKLTSKFDDTRAYSGIIDFRYTPYGTIAKNVKLYVDDKLYKEETISVTGEEQAINISGLTHNVHTFKLEMSATINGTKIESNDLVYSVIYVVEGNEEILISSKFDKKEAKQGELLSIDYLVYNPLSEYTDVKLSINEDVVNEVSVDRSRQYWNLTSYPSGSVTFDIVAYKGGEPAQAKSFVVQVKEAEINVLPVTTNLELYLSAQSRSNSEPIGERRKWEYGEISATLNGFNWSTNGWKTDSKGNNLLRLNGKANVYIPFNIFETDFLGLGKTIEFDFATTDIYDISKLLVSCYANDKGFQITSNDTILKSEQTEVSTKFKEDERIRVSFVIQSSASNRLVKTFINGECCGLAQYPESDEFKQANPVGITINNLEGSIDIYSIRIYNQDLTDKQMLNNYMADLSLNDKISSYTRNNILDDYGQVAYSKVKTLIPILIITGSLPGAKGDKKIVKASFENPFDSSYNFTYDGVEIDIQGTSSQFFPRKNYKLKFPTKFAFRQGAVEEKTYTFKADYMESSHSHNTGNAKFINSISPQFPTQATDSKVRNTINGYPIVIFVRSSDSADLEYYGVFNFNNDKGNSDTLGLTTPYAESWEFKNNISARCLFRTDDFTGKVEDDFEARYPKDYKDYTNLSRVVSWVYSTQGNVEKFKEEFEQYFNKDFCLFYYVMMEVMLAVDSRAKNMFLDTLDGQIWYPRWYDIDTTYGLNNEGVNQFSYGLEQHDFIGDVAVFNGENSLLWNNFEEAFADEIATYYYNLRSEGKLSYETIYNIIYGEQISKISQAMYNTDGNFKYVGPLVEDNDTTYLYVEQGSRLNHFQWWLSNRFKYLDSKYEYADFKDDFISMRTYTPDEYVVVPTNYFNLVPFTDMYCQVLFGSSKVRERAIANEVQQVAAPSGLKFNNTETIIYGASRILDVGDLSTKYARTMDFSKAVKLKRLKIGSEVIGYQNTNLNELTIGNNTMLEQLDIRNCPNLTQSIDLTGCLNIKEVYASGTNISAVNLASGGNLTTLDLPSSVTNLILVNQPLLTKFTMPSYASIKSLRLEEVAIDSLPIVKQATELERVRLVGIDWQLTNAEQIILKDLLNVRGFNADGSSSDKAVLVGKIHIAGLISDRDLKAWNKYFNNQETTTPVNPNLVITADEIGVTHVVRFLDYQGNVLEEQIVPNNTTTTYNGETPTKPTNTELKEKYTFSGWTPSLSTPITSSVDFTPTFTITKYWQYIFLNGNGTEIYRGFADNGTYVTYNSDVVPTKEKDSDYSYSFSNSWTPSLAIPITKDTMYTPQFNTIPLLVVEWRNFDGEILGINKVGNGESATYQGSTPTKPADNMYKTYNFVGWQDGKGNAYTESYVPNVSSNMTLTAQFAGGLPQTYTVYWYSEGVLLEQDNDVPYGSIAEYNGETPVHSKGYTFEGWGTNDFTIISDTSFYAEFATPSTFEVIVVNEAYYKETTPKLKLKGISETYDLDIDWGDGTKDTYTLTKDVVTECAKSSPYVGTDIEYTITIPATNNFEYVDRLFNTNYGNVFVYVKNAKIKKTSVNNAKQLFGYEKRLTKFSLPLDTIKLGDQFFASCTSLEEVDLSIYNIQTIGRDLFKGCTSLKKVIMPKDVNIFTTSVFQECTRLEEVDLSNYTLIPTLSNYNYTFMNVPPTCKIIIPDSLYERWIATTNWVDLYTNNLLTFVKASEVSN